MPERLALLYETLSRACPILCFARACVTHLLHLSAPNTFLRLTCPLPCSLSLSLSLSVYIYVCIVPLLFAVLVLVLVSCFSWSFVDAL